MKDASVLPSCPRAARPDFSVAATAVTSIGQQTDKTAVLALMDAYRARGPSANSSTCSWKWCACWESWVRSKRKPPLTEATTHEDARVRVAAVESLKKLGLPAPELPSERSFHEALVRPRAQEAVGAAVWNSSRGHPHQTRAHRSRGCSATTPFRPSTNFINWAKTGFYKKLTSTPRGAELRRAGRRPARRRLGRRRFHHPVGGCRAITTTRAIWESRIRARTPAAASSSLHSSPQRQLDGRYTIFGRVTKGMENV